MISIHTGNKRKCQFFCRCLVVSSKWVRVSAQLIMVGKIANPKKCQVLVCTQNNLVLLTAHLSWKPEERKCCRVWISLLFLESSQEVHWLMRMAHRKFSLLFVTCSWMFKKKWLIRYCILHVYKVIQKNGETLGTATSLLLWSKLRHSCWFFFSFPSLFFFFSFLNAALAINLSHKNNKASFMLPSHFRSFCWRSVC